MTGLLGKAALGAALAASTLVAAAPAQAQYGRGGYGGYRHGRGGGDVAAGAIIGGIVGLGLGAAIANGNNRGRYNDRGYYYDQPRAVYREEYYRQPRVIYREQYYSPPVVYRDRYYGGGYGGGYGGRGYHDQRGYYGY